MDIHARAQAIRDGIEDPTFIADLDQEAMAFRAECRRIGKTVAQVAEEIFRAACRGTIDASTVAWVDQKAARLAERRLGSMRRGGR